MTQKVPAIPAVTSDVPLNTRRVLIALKVAVEYLLTKQGDIPDRFSPPSSGQSGSGSSAAAAHNLLPGLQGGSTDERYHLTADQHTGLTSGGDSDDHYHSADRDLSQALGQLRWDQIDLTGASLTDFGPILHSVLSDVQGGSATEQYHLTADQWTQLVAGTITALHTHAHGDQDGLGNDDHLQYVLNIADRLVVSVTSPSAGDQLTFDGTYWVASDANKGYAKVTGVPSDQTGAYLTTLEYDASTRTWTVLPIAPATTFDVFVQGVRHTFSSIVQTHPATVGGHFLYVDLDGSVVVATTPWSLIHDAPISYVYFDGVLGLPFDERHHAGRDVWWHQNQHRNEGTKAGAGFALTGYTLNDGSSDAAVTFAISSGRVEDEDIAVDTQAVADGGPYTGMYRSGSGGWLFVRSLSRPFFDASNALQFNQFSGGTWSRAAVPEDRFVNYWFFALTALPKEGINGWGASPSQIIFVPGQTTYATEAEAHAESVSSLLWGDMPFQEIAPLYQVTLRFNAAPGAGGPAYTNTARCAITRVVRVVGSASIITQAATIDHGSLVGLQDDDHTTLYPRWSGSTRADFYGAPLPADPQNTAPTDLVNGDLFFYNAANARWESGRQTVFALTSGTTRADFLCDSPAEGNVLRFDAVAGKWKSIANPFEEQSQKGAANGYAPLNASQKIEAFYLPSYVDDVVEYANLAAFPGTGETGLIYVALDSNKIYRWSGSAYVEISPSPGSTDSVTEGVSNLYFTAQRVRDTVLTGLSLASSAVISATDTVLSALGKLQAQVSAVLSSLTTHTGQTSGAHGISAYGATLIDDDSAATARTTLGLGDAATKNVGTTAGTVAAGDHTHAGLGGVYEPVTFRGELVTVGEAGTVLVVPYVESTFDVWGYWDAASPRLYNTVLSRDKTAAHKYGMAEAWGANALVATTFPLSAGKRVFELSGYVNNVADTSSDLYLGFCTDDQRSSVGVFAAINLPSMVHSGTGATWTAINDTDAAGATLMFAVDLDAGKLWIAKGGVWYSGDPAAGTSPSATWTGGTALYVAALLSPVTGGYASAVLTTAFGDMTQTPPAGFVEWKTTVTV